MITEARGAARRKGAFIMMVEQDLMLARFLAGLYSHKVHAAPHLTHHQTPCSFTRLVCLKGLHSHTSSNLLSCLRSIGSGKHPMGHLIYVPEFREQDITLEKLLAWATQTLSEEAETSLYWSITNTSSYSHSGCTHSSACMSATGAKSFNFNSQCQQQH